MNPFPNLEVCNDCSARGYGDVLVGCPCSKPFYGKTNNNRSFPSARSMNMPVPNRCKHKLKLKSYKQRDAQTVKFDPEICIRCILKESNAGYSQGILRQWAKHFVEDGVMTLCPIDKVMNFRCVFVGPPDGCPYLTEHALSTQKE